MESSAIWSTAKAWPLHSVSQISSSKHLREAKTLGGARTSQDEARLADSEAETHRNEMRVRLRFCLGSILRLWRLPRDAADTTYKIIIVGIFEKRWALSVVSTDECNKVVGNKCLHFTPLHRRHPGPILCSVLLAAWLSNRWGRAAPFRCPQPAPRPEPAPSPTRPPAHGHPASRVPYATGLSAAAG